MAINQNTEIRDDIIIGRNAVLEALNSDREIDCLWLQKGSNGPAISKIVGKCRDKGVTIKEVAVEKLNGMIPGGNHQGVAITIAAHKYYEIEEILQAAETSGKPLFLLVLDEIEDPHNLGAIIRTAEATGVDGIIIPKRRAVGLNYTVAKVASGAIEHVKIARVSNLTAAIETLKQKGVWVYGADVNGEDFTKVDFKGNVALVIGSEGKGISRLIKEHCDHVVGIPMTGKINSLNASVATGILLFNISQNR